MTVYLLTYDLMNESSSQDYKPLYKELERLGGHRTMLSVWLVNVNNTPAELRDHILKFMDKNDRLFVTRLRKLEYARHMTYVGTNDWLTSNPPS